jgi:hypothetical protein
MADLSKEPVQAEPFNFTKYTSIGSASVAAVIAAYMAIRQVVDDDVDPLVTLGLLVAVGLVALAMAVAAAADVLARSYVTSNTTVDPEDEGKLLPASVVLAEAMKKQGEETKVVAMPHLEGVKVGGRPATLLAMHITKDETQFQVRLKNEAELKLVDPVAVEFPQARA